MNLLVNYFITKFLIIFYLIFSRFVARSPHICSQWHACPFHSIRAHEAATFLVDAINYKVSNFMLSR